MTLDDVLDLFDLWRDEPPVQWMVQAYLGIEKKPTAPPDTRVPAGAIPSIPFKP